MSAGWVAGTVRARAMVTRRLGTAGVRSLAGCGSLPAAVEMLARSPYGPRVHSGQTLPEAARGIAATVLWNLRVLAGWTPARGADMLRALASWFEIANVDEQLRALAGHTPLAPFELGTLATAWPQLSRAGSLDELRTALATSAWGDPGGTTPREIQFGMRLSWAARVVAHVPAARTWALGAVALVVARERLGRADALPDGPALTTSALIGPGWAGAGSLDALRSSLPSAARWAVADLTDVENLWSWEARWWRRVRADAGPLSARHGFGPDQLVGSAALIAADAWLAIGALETATRGTVEREVLDALA